MTESKITCIECGREATDGKEPGDLCMNARFIPGVGHTICTGKLVEKD